MKILISMTLVSYLLLAHAIKVYRGGPLEIIEIGHPTLNQVALEIPFEDIKLPETQTLIDQMIKTMKNAGGVGLAAPQVNISKRLFVMKPSFFRKAQAVINPTIEYITDAGTKNSSEGCLSIPGKTFTVKRYKKINVTYFDRKADYQAERLEGFKAIVFQHEYDHLNGLLISEFFSEEFIYAPELMNTPQM